MFEKSRLVIELEEQIGPVIDSAERAIRRIIEAETENSELGFQVLRRLQDELITIEQSIISILEETI